MKKLAVLMLAGVVSAAMAQDTVMTQTRIQEGVQTQAQSGNLEQLRVQLREKLSLAMEQATPECEKAQQAALALQTRLQDKNAAERKAIMEQERARVQAQIKAGMKELNKASAQINKEVEQAKRQVMAEVQEKMRKMKELQARIKAQGGPDRGGN
ncbi:MAG: hypothetical protein JXA71_09670 [Chitinispirillaceae bacterium]|nr:hypothetical protein [Chitinispirillaceae bacterium]